MNPDIKIYPSILAADMGRLAEECRRAGEAGADGLHVDIMDGQFVNNISMGLDVIKTVRESVELPLSVHLMIMRPDWYVGRVVENGAQTVLIHAESPCDVPATLGAIRSAGARAGITLNPESPADMLEAYTSKIDEILCMSVHPGFGGQAFIPQVLPKIAALRRSLPRIPISIDGGINTETAVTAAAHGANVFFVGTTIFRSPDMAAAIADMRGKAAAAWSDAPPQTHAT